MYEIVYICFLYDVCHVLICLSNLVLCHAMYRLTKQIGERERERESKHIFYVLLRKLRTVLHHSSFFRSGVFSELSSKKKHIVAHFPTIIEMA